MELKHVARGCIKKTAGPWIVRRASAKGGHETTGWRIPSAKERDKNRQRERLRRAVAAKIFAGLRAHGNYCLPKHADHNEVLKALCNEAGWHVEQDGTTYRKNSGFELPALKSAGTSRPTSSSSHFYDQRERSQTQSRFELEQGDLSWNGKSGGGERHDVGFVVRYKREDMGQGLPMLSEVVLNAVHVEQSEKVQHGNPQSSAFIPSAVPTRLSLSSKQSQNVL
ncbi:hypothetical protein SUGI_0923940 [Cryptomeria japonica]|uniref:protein BRASSINAZOLE-RESISTANT 2 n=1 Tax=Cryptomeria japonica TaxID=3369 RepID=UPI002414BBCB|nr:protein BRASSINAZOLE-RESISTANT 2 [Cryptomeria japonica]XP_057816442.1 protein BRASSINAZOLE-RESISTANT 2 [Cryptomeria japonica]GLJ44231.1 hypothetical protein SUGI_0923940 [Cryptomeria japonica]